MKRPITPAYTFTPGASTLNLSGIAGFDIRNLFAVIDLKTGALIYAPLAGTGYSALSGTTLTLQAPMTGLSGSDPLLILYDDGGKPAEDASVQAVTTALGTLNTALSANHSDLATLHADVGTTLHADLQAILTKQPASPALDGADATGVAMPSGGAGIRGWLSALYKAITGGAPNPPSLRATGTLAALNDAIILQVDGMHTAIIQLATGAWAGGPAVFEASADNQATWTAVNLLLYAGSAPTSSTAAGGLWEMACGGLTHLRVRASAAITGGPVAAVVAATNGLKSIRVGNPSANPLTVSAGKTATAGDAAITAGGTAQTLFAGATPANGWKVANPDPGEDLWVSDSATAAPNGQGSYRVPAGGIITTEPLERPCGPLSVYGASTGHVITARSW